MSRNRLSRSKFRLQCEQLENRLLLATYHVAVDGNDSNSGALESPFSTIQHAVQLAQPGDTVLVRGGTYRETIASVRSGLANSPITIESYNNETVIVSANDVVDGPWTETSPGSGIFSAQVSGSLPGKFWNNPSSFITENDGSLNVNIVNSSTYSTQILSSAASSSSWNFFASPYTWKVRGISAQSAGTTPMPLSNATAYFSIKPTTTGGFEGEDSVNVFYSGNGRLSLQPKKNTINSWGVSVGSVTDATISGFDLTLGPGTLGNVQYQLVAYPSGQTVATGQWAMAQSDWSDGGNGSTSHVNIFVQETVVATDTSQQFVLKVGSYEIFSGPSYSNPVLRDEFANNDPASVEYYPAGRNIAISSGYDQVLVDGVMQNEARYPNKVSDDLLIPDATAITMNNTYQATGTAFGSRPNNFFAGARFMSRVGSGWAWQASKVLSSTGSTLQLDSTALSTWWWPNQANKTSDPGIAFVYGKLEFLDADKEWFLQQNANGPDTLYIRVTAGANPSSRVVEHKVRNWTVNIGGHDNIIVRGFQFVGGAIQIKGNSVVFEENDARYLSHYLTFTNGGSDNGGRTEGGGVVVSGSNNVIRGNTIHDTAGSGILASGVGHLITRNHVYNTDYSGTYAAGLTLSGSGHIATFNTIHDSGRDIVRPNGQGLTVMYNDLYRAGRMALDLGLIYTFGINGADANGKQTRIAYNWVHETGNRSDSLSHGIYLDNYARNFIVDHNVIWDLNSTGSRSSVRINSPSVGNQMFHNTLIGAPEWNEETFSSFNLSYTDPFWTSANHGMNFTSQNNLIVPNVANVGAFFENYAERDFRLKAGATAIDPTTVSGVVQWVTSNGVTNVPAGFRLNMVNKNQQFTYREVTGSGIVLSGINDGFVGGTPDNGAYEKGVGLWQAGINGFASGDLGITISMPTLVGGSATLRGTLESIGPTATSAQVDAFWGSSDAGIQETSWQNSVAVANGLAGNSVPLAKQITGLSNGQTYWYRLRATNNLGQVNWTEPRSFVVSNAQPTNITLSSTTINENTTGGTIGTLTVTDTDAGDLHQFVVSDLRFEVVNGILKLKPDQSLDFETTPIIQISITAADLGGRAYSKSFNITVNDQLELASSISIGDGQANRSNIQKLKFAFDKPISLDAGAFRVEQRNKDSNGALILVPVTTQATTELLGNGQTLVTLTFSGSLTRGASNSLVDGNYQLTIDGSKVRITNTNTMFDGDKNPSTPGGEHVFGGNATDRFFAQFGNMNSDRMVNESEYATFRRAYTRQRGQSGYQETFDFDGNGVINLADFAAFRRNYGKRMTF